MTTSKGFCGVKGINTLHVKCYLGNEHLNNKEISLHTQSGQSRAWTISNTDDDAEQQELSFMAGGNSNGTATLEDTLIASYITE